MDQRDIQNIFQQLRVVKKQQQVMTEDTKVQKQQETVSVQDVKDIINQQINDPTETRNDITELIIKYRNMTASVMVLQFLKRQDEWFFRTSDGTDAFSVDLLSATNYQLSNNFICDDIYDGPGVVIDGTNMSTCHAQDLSALTQTGRCVITNLSDVKLSSKNNKCICIKLYGKQNINLICDTIQTEYFNVIGENVTLILNGVVKTDVYWNIIAPNILIQQFQFQSTQYIQQISKNTITQIKCTGKIEFIEKYQGTIKFQTIVQYQPQTNVRAVQYISSWQ